MVKVDVLEQRVCNLEKNMADGFIMIMKRMDKSDSKQLELFNHMSERPTKQAAKTNTILVAIITALLSILSTFVVAVLFS